jgi:hypothetical protein
MPIQVIELKDSDTAVYGDVVYTARANGYDPVPPVIRRLIAEHLISPDDLVEVRRGTALASSHVGRGYGPRSTSSMILATMWSAAPPSSGRTSTRLRHPGRVQAVSSTNVCSYRPNSNHLAG